MLLYLVPQGTNTVSADVVAQVGDHAITTHRFNGRLSRIEQNGPVPAALRSLYAQQVLNQLVFEKELAAKPMSSESASPMRSAPIASAK